MRSGLAAAMARSFPPRSRSAASMPNSIPCSSPSCRTSRTANRSIALNPNLSPPSATTCAPPDQHPGRAEPDQQRQPIAGEGKGSSGHRRTQRPTPAAPDFRPTGSGTHQCRDDFLQPAPHRSRHGNPAKRRKPPPAVGGEEPRHRLGSAQGPLWVLGDPDRLAQVVVNIFGNAIQFFPEGGSIAIRAAIAEGTIRDEITDHGPGIPPDFLLVMFYRFRQLESRVHAPSMAPWRDGRRLGPGAEHRPRPGRPAWRTGRRDLDPRRRRHGIFRAAEQINIRTMIYPFAIPRMFVNLRGAPATLTAAPGRLGADVLTGLTALCPTRFLSPTITSYFVTAWQWFCTISPRAPVA